MSSFLKGRRARSLPEPPPMWSPAPRRQAPVAPGLDLIRALWAAQGGEGLPPLAGGAQGTASTATGGSAGVGAQGGEAPGFDFPRGGLPTTLPRKALEALPNLREYGARGDFKTDDTEAIAAAIAATFAEGTAGPNGGMIYVPPGVYLHEGSPSMKELTNVHFVGSGAQVGGGGIGVGAPVGSSVFVYSGAGARGWDFRSSWGCDLRDIHCFANNAAFTGPIWDLSGTEPKPSGGGHFTNSRAEATRPTVAANIIECIGALLDFSNIHTFDNCTFSSCFTGTEGVNNAAHSSVGHRFNSCFWAGNQSTHCANPQEAWTFDGCVAESLFTNKGIISNKPRFIAYNKVMQSHGVNVLSCWSGSNVPASRAGVNIEARGEGWIILGGSLNTAEVGVFFPEGAIASIVAGVRMWKLNSGITTTGKTIRSLLAFNNPVETIAVLSDTIKEYSKSLYENEAGALTLAP